ncbi:hypothetical protein [Streptomyces sp. NPDC047000]|uniref:hypothetical protein n=1 Tax=Streptomyces sp. NPDC047000 TaxID=3155474 RepID=UPI0033C96371
MVKGRKRQVPSGPDPFKPSLADHWAETDGNVTVLGLHREITARGFRGHSILVHGRIRREPPRQKASLPPHPRRRYGR